MIIGKQIIVLGAGKTGLTLALALAKSGHVVRLVDNYVTDLTNHLPDLKGTRVDERASLSLVMPEEIAWPEVGVVYCSPGIPTNFPQPHPVVKDARDHNIPISSDIDWLLGKLSPATPVIGVTGTNGKSTTAALTSYILSQYPKFSPALAGANFGIPVAIMAEKKPVTYVLELSSFQLELMHTPRINIGALLNITPDHMDRYASFDDYTAAKAKLIELLSPNGTMVVGVDDEATQAVFDKYSSKHKLVPISVQRVLEGGVSWVDGKLYNNYFDGQPRQVALPNLTYENLPGEHNRQNILAVIVIAMTLGLNLDEHLFNKIAEFSSLPHRLELVYRSQKLSIYNDSKATNMDAASKALASFDNILWLAGGRLKDNDFTPVLPYLSNVKKVYTFGEAAHMLASYFAGKVEVASFPGLRKALAAAWKEAKEDKSASPQVILLAPGGSSFDEFSNFEHRGESYKNWCRDLPKLNRA